MKKISFFLCFTFLCFRLYSQVNLPTGSATFSLPMFSWQDDKSRLNAVVALNYNSGNGLKVDDVASNVGQGWNLLAGGVITRMQVGEPDDQKAYTDGTPEKVEDEFKYPAGYLYNPDNILSKGCPIALKKYPLFEDKNHIYRQNNIVAEDRELDYFSFQFNGRSGMFVLQKNSNSFCLFLGDSKLIGWFEENLTLATHTLTGIRTTITAFNIKDENGLIYRFANYSKTKVLKNGYCDANQIEMQTQPHFDNNKVYHEGSFDQITKDPYVINGWYLTSITDVLTNRVITFNYNVTLNINNIAGNSIAYYTNKNYSIISHRYSKTIVPQLSSIVFPDQHLVSLTYNSTQRFDLSGDQALASVDISYQGRSLSKYLLNTTYFIRNRYGTPSSDDHKKYARLCLRSVKKIGVDLKADDNPYIFDYYRGSEANLEGDDYVPYPFCFLKDIWGFYNGKNSGPYGTQTPLIKLDKSVSELTTDETFGLCFARPNQTTPISNSKSGYAKNGLLRQIIYPTGGTLTYTYEQNRASVSGGAQQDVGGVHVSKISLTDGGFSNGCSNPIETTYNYLLSGSTNSSLWGVETPDNTITANNGYAPERKKFYYKPPFEFGCKYVFQYPGILSREDKITLTDFQKFMNIASTVLSIVSVITTVMDVVNLIGASTVAAYWVAVIIDIIGSLLSIALTCFTNVSKETSFDILCNYDLNSFNPLPVQYSRVEVVQGTGGIGKTVDEFTSSADYALWDPPIYQLNSDQQTLQQQSMKQRYAYWAYGLPKKITAYDVNGYKVSETEYKYDWSNAKHYAAGFKFINNSASYKCLVLKNVSQRSEWWDDPMQDPVGYNSIPGNFLTASSPTDPELEIESYYIYSGRVEDTAVYERTFKPNSGQYLETVTKYKYNTDNYQPNQITTIQSNGDQNIQAIKYTSDYATSGGVLASLIQSNIVGLPVESNSSVLINGSASSIYLNEKVTEFTQLANGDIKPSRILEQRFNQPQSSMTIYYGPGSTTTPPYYETQSFIYDANNNLVGIKDEGNHIVANIYDYNDKYIIASVINADPLLDKSSYTSFETGNLGGWVLTGGGTSVTGTSITGSNYFPLSSGKNFKVTSLNTAKSYRVSFWSTSALTVAGGATLVKSAPVINGFTYYEYKIAQGTASVTVSGTGNIDELRLYPETARMRTVNYDPLIGKTSECDENNRITYYDYDEKARLKLIRDENRSIVKMYEYNTVSNKQAGCPGTYNNNLITEIFTKNNCGVGYIGGNITYTIPPGKYTSIISQQDADQQAETEINTNGQNTANTTGTCIQVWKNIYMSQDFTTEGCAPGTTGGIVPYSVPANRYTSTLSQADANSMAQEEIDANGQAYANSVAHLSCIYSNQPDWQGDENSAQRCQKDVNQNYTGHIEVMMTDVNPNSATYNQTAWQDAGFDETTCPHTVGNAPSLSTIGYSTKSGSGVIVGTPGTSITVTVILNSSSSDADLSGNIGTTIISPTLHGSGNTTKTYPITIPAAGYISWKLTLSGTLGTGGYISSNISYQ